MFCFFEVVQYIECSDDSINILKGEVAWNGTIIVLLYKKFLEQIKKEAIFCGQMYHIYLLVRYIKYSTTCDTISKRKIYGVSLL